jgi:hypothetical protein
MFTLSLCGLIIQVTYFSQCSQPLRRTYVQTEFEVLTAVVINSSLFWDITTCSPPKVNRRFGVTYRLHLQGRRISQTKHHCHLFHAGFLLGLFFDSNDGGDKFLRNVRWLSTESTELYPIRKKSSITSESKALHQSKQGSRLGINWQSGMLSPVNVDTCGLLLIIKRSHTSH